MKKKLNLVLIGALLISNIGYSEEEYQEKVVKLSAREKITYTGLGLGGLAGVVLIADSISSDSDGTKVEVGDPPPEEVEPAPMVAAANTYVDSYNRGSLRDIGRTTLYLEDISKVFKDMGRMKKGGKEDEVSIFLQPIDRRNEYEGVVGGAYLIKDMGEYREIEVRGSLGYGHGSVDYEDGADGSSEVLHCALHLDYERSGFRNYTWLSNEFSYNRFEDGETARYKGTALSLGTENGYVVTAGRFQIIPFVFLEGSFYKREAIDLGDVRAGSDNFTSFKWGPGIEGNHERQAGNYNTLASVRVVYRMEEGDIYDEVSTSRGSVENLAEDETLEVSVEGEVKRGGVSVFTRLAYYLQKGDDIYSGTLGLSYKL